MSHAARWVSDADGDAWQFHRAQRQQVSSAVTQGRGRCCDEGSLFFIQVSLHRSCFVSSLFLFVMQTKMTVPSG